ncbi:MAG TPA: hypothetical protein VKI44_23880 [Acetobacteraceae bacterium]|nr:hypothetical protein [Acetobacteraceae bacterium]
MAEAAYGFLQRIASCEQLAQPETRLGKVRIGGQSGAIFRNRCVDAAKLCQQRGQSVVRFRVTGLGCKYRFVTGNRRLGATGRLQTRGQTKAGVQHPRPERKRAFVLRGRLFVAAQRLECRGEIAKRFRRSRRYRCGPPQQRFRLVGLALTEAKRPKVDQCIEVCRLSREDQLIGAGGFIRSALAMQRECLLELHPSDPASVR